MLRYSSRGNSGLQAAAAAAAGGSSTTTTTTNWILKCTDLPQFDACQAQADLFRTDDKLHLRNLCNDTARCASLIAIYTSPASFKSCPKEYKMIFDYSRQLVTGETMEQLFDLADAVGLTSRRQAMYDGSWINATEHKPVLHHVLRMPAYYNLELAQPVVVEPGGSSSSCGGAHDGDFHLHHSFSRGSTRTTDNPLLSRDESGGSTTTAAAAVGMDGPAVLRQVHAMRQKIQDFCYRVRSGDYVSVTGQHVFKNTIVIGGDGCCLGTECVAEALKADPVAEEASGPDRRLVFVSSADPVNVHLAVHDLNPAETLVIIISKTFATSDNPVMLNARTILHEWMVDGIRRILPIKKWNEQDVIAKHCLAITTDTDVCRNRCREFGVAVSNIFAIPDYVSPRYSVCSAVGLLPLSLQYSYPVMADFLDGAHDIDEHFFHAPLRDNIPVILGLLGVWNSTFLGYSSRALLPYAKSLHRFPAFVQHIDMESNGKRVALDGTPLLHQSGEIDFGEVDAQTSFFQLLHQGRVVPSTFIGFMESQQPVDLPGEAVSNHDELMSNFFAQPDALAYGKTLVDLVQEGVAEPLREHMVFTGNRPSSSLLLSRLDAFAMGQLVALYEHRTAVQGFIWGINSFDQFGNELGSVLAKHVRGQLSASRKTGASVQGFNASTSTLLEHYLSHDKDNSNLNPSPQNSPTS